MESEKVIGIITVIASLVAVLVTLINAGTSARKSAFQNLVKVVEEVREENMRLRQDITKLQAENDKLRKENLQLRRRDVERDAKIRKQAMEIATLNKRLDQMNGEKK